MPEAALLEVFMSRVRKSKNVMAVDIAHFDRMEIGNPDRSIEWMMRRMYNIIERDRMNRTKLVHVRSVR